MLSKFENWKRTPHGVGGVTADDDRGCYDPVGPPIWPPVWPRVRCYLTSNSMLPVSMFPYSPLPKFYFEVIHLWNNMTLFSLEASLQICHTFNAMVLVFNVCYQTVYTYGVWQLGFSFHLMHSKRGSST